MTDSKRLQLPTMRSVNAVIEELERWVTTDLEAAEGCTHPFTVKMVADRACAFGRAIKILQDFPNWGKVREETRSARIDKVVDREALNDIVELLSGKEWSADSLSRVVGIVQETGCVIEDVPEAGDEEA